MKSHFFIKLIPPRRTFPKDITSEENAVMQEHAAYWTTLMDQGKVHVFGPVFDPEGTFGMGVFSVDSEDEARQLMAQDPAATIGMNFRIAPMKAILPTRN